MKFPQKKSGLESHEEVITVEDEPEYKIILRWRNIIAFIYLHIFTVVSLFYPPLEWSTYVYQFFLAVFIGQGQGFFFHKNIRAFKHNTELLIKFLFTLKLWNNSWKSQTFYSSNIQSKTTSQMVYYLFTNNGWSGANLQMGETKLSFVVFFNLIC